MAFRWLGAFLLLSLTVVGAAQTPASPPYAFSQDRINHLAAGCLSAEKAMRGLTARRRDGETESAYQQRLRGYFDALSRLERTLTPLSRRAEPRDSSASNLAVWRRIEENHRLLTQQIAAARALHRRLLLERDPARRPEAQTRLGRSLAAALATLRHLFNSLRDARP
jgi:hypothetical protein